MQPKQVTIRLTDSCNARCKMCEIWKQENANQFDSLLLDSLPRSLESVSLSGGEPFLRNDLPEIVERIKFVCNKSRIVILTNGILTEVITERVRKIIGFNPKIAIRLSIDAIGELHDNIRGIKNAYLYVMNTLKSLKKLGIRDIGVAITVTDINIAEIAKVYKMSLKEGIKFNFLVAHSSDFYYRRRDNDIGKRDLFKKELNAVILSELKSFSLQRLFKAYYYRGLWNYVNCLPRTYFCNAGSLFFYLSPKGSIYPCQFLNKEMGNLKNSSFSVIWNSKTAERIRQDVRRCNLNCWTVSTVAPGIKSNPFRAAKWVFMNKLKDHLGKADLL